MRNDLSLGEFVAVDPAIRSAGIALYRGGNLVSASAVKLASDTDENIAARCLEMAESLARWVVRHQATPRALVFEWPQIYRVAKSKGNPNDLVPLAGVGMALAGILAMGVASRNVTLEVVSNLEVVAFTAGEWTPAAGKKETRVSKVADAMRTKRIMRRLTDDERAAIEGIKSHDALDAVAIGLHALGRLEPERVYPGASE